MSIIFGRAISHTFVIPTKGEEFLPNAGACGSDLDVLTALDDITDTLGGG